MSAASRYRARLAANLASADHNQQNNRKPDFPFLLFSSRIFVAVNLLLTFSECTSLTSTPPSWTPSTTPWSTARPEATALPDTTGNLLSPQSRQPQHQSLWSRSCLVEWTKVKLLLDRKSRAEPPPKTRQWTGPHMLRHLPARVAPSPGAKNIKCLKMWIKKLEPTGSETWVWKQIHLMWRTSSFIQQPRFSWIFNVRLEFRPHFEWWTQSIYCVWNLKYPSPAFISYLF